jgi:hypothetical protein
MCNNFLTKQIYSQCVICNFKSELKFWKIFNGIKIMIVMIVIARVIKTFSCFIFLILQLLTYQKYFYNSFTTI